MNISAGAISKILLKVRHRSKEPLQTINEEQPSHHRHPKPRMEDPIHFGGIKIPISENASGSEKERVIFFPDELPEDHQVLGDVLKGVLAPFKVWRTCAVSF